MVYLEENIAVPSAIHPAADELNNPGTMMAYGTYLVIPRSTGCP